MPDVTVKATGPLFDLNAVSEIEKAKVEIFLDLTTEGERNIKLQLIPGHGLISGHYRRSIHGEVAGSRYGRVHDSKVVYGAWLEGVSSRNQRTRFKGYAMFRNAKQALEKLKDAVVRRRISQMVKRLGG